MEIWMIGLICGAVGLLIGGFVTYILIQRSLHKSEASLSGLEAERDLIQLQLDKPEERIKLSRA